VQADDLLARDAGDAAERRVLGLRGEQLGLRHEGQRGKVVQRPHRPVAEQLAEEGRAGADALDLRRQEILLEAALLVERKPLDLGVDVAAGCDQGIL